MIKLIFNQELDRYLFFTNSGHFAMYFDVIPQWLSQNIFLKEIKPENTILEIME